MPRERVLDNPHRRKRRDANAWRLVMSRFEESGLRVPQFCEREGIGAASFYQWRSRLGSSSSRRKVSRAPEPVVASARGDFLDLGTLGSGTSPVQVRLDLGGGVVVHLTRS